MKVSAAQAQVQLNGQRISTATNTTQNSTHGQVELRIEEHPLGHRISLHITPQRQATLGACQIEIPCSLQEKDLVLCNGFQSWTDSRWLHPTGSIPNLRRIARPLMGYYGDYHIPWIKRQKGYLHSWSWTELRATKVEAITFLGSLNENDAFTCFQWQFQAQSLVITADCRGHQITEPFTVLDVLVLNGNPAAVYDAWVEQLRLPALRTQPARGWTSWYQHYVNISEEIIADNLKAYQDRQDPIDFFQIDDGYQTAVGDWLSITDKFPDGMRAMAKRIREAGPTPGLWLAPCVADKRSNLLQQHPDWVAKTPKGKPIKAGYNPLWGGWYYALDTNQKGWQDYMREVFETVTKDWGYGLLKLDFLFAACLYPTATQTRAQRMRSTLEFIRSVSGDAYLLGCGTPLASGFGLFDYCRIGADIHLSWEHKLLRWFRHRERVSTLVALRTTLARWPLAGRVWRNDPDVYLLREDNIQLNRQERALVQRINTLAGELLFTSDDVGTYGSWQHQEEEWQQEWFSVPITDVSPQGETQTTIHTPDTNFKVLLDHKGGHLTANEGQ